MRVRALLTTGAAALLLGTLPVAALAQETTDDPDDLDRTFVPSAPGSEGGADAGATTSDPAPSSDDLPNTGGGLAVAGGAAVAGAAVLRRRRP